MQTLKQRNQIMASFYATDTRSRAGVACDDCGHELVFESNETLLTNPPKRRVQCPKCGKRDMLLG